MDSFQSVDLVSLHTFLVSPHCITAGSRFPNVESLTSQENRGVPYYHGRHVMLVLTNYVKLVGCSRYNVPLVADIHFAPPIAMRVAECFDKIRINPGNFGEYWLVFLFLSRLCKV